MLVSISKSQNMHIKHLLNATFVITTCDAKVLMKLLNFVPYMGIFLVLIVFLYLYHELSLPDDE